MPVEQPSVIAAPSIEAPSHLQAQTRKPAQDEDIMQLDDSKHKVYIYSIDDELSESDSDDGKLVFLPDIEKHLRKTRIPQSILANSEGELAGNKQMVLYNVPHSLTVPEKQDSVRKAIIEARARLRAKQEQKREADIGEAQTLDASVKTNLKTGNSSTGVYNGNPSSFPVWQVPVDNDPDAMDLG